MERRFYRELWSLRFKKMLDLELQSITAYEGLLKECRQKYGEHAIAPQLEALISDEKKHAALVRELLDILAKQPG